MMRRTTATVVALLALALASGRASAEIVEDVVAWVGGDIITLSELEEEERLVTEDLYRRYTGDDLDRELEQARSQILMQMIDRKILLQRAERLFDVDSLKQGLLEDFMDANKIDSEEQLQTLLAREGLTVETLKERLIENVAPSEIVRIEVRNRLSVSDTEVEEYYRDHPEEFTTPAEVTLKEIVFLTTDDDKEEQLQKAKSVREQAVVPGADFEALAREYSEAGTASSGGTLGPVGKGDLISALEEVALRLPVGEVSDVLEMPYGYQIIRVESRTDEKRLTLEEVRDDLRTSLEGRKYVEQLDAFLKRARQEADWEVKPRYQDRLPKR